MTIYNVTDATFKNTLQSKGLTIVNFWAPWCGLCRVFAPILKAYDAERNNDVKILKVNMHEYSETAAFYGILNIPATVIFKDGVAVDKENGFMSVDELKQFIIKNQ